MKAYQYDRGSGVRFEVTASELDELAAVQRLAGIDFSRGVFNARGHGLDGVLQACYRIEYRRLQGVKTFSFQ